MATKKKTEKAMVEVISTMSPNEAEKTAFQAQIKGFDVHFNAIEGGYCKVRSAVLEGVPSAQAARGPGPPARREGRREDR